MLYFRDIQRIVIYQCRGAQLISYELEESIDIVSNVSCSEILYRYWYSAVSNARLLLLLAYWLPCFAYYPRWVKGGTMVRGEMGWDRAGGGGSQRLCAPMSVKTRTDTRNGFGEGGRGGRGGGLFPAGLVGALRSPLGTRTPGPRVYPVTAVGQ